MVGSTVGQFRARAWAQFRLEHAASLWCAGSPYRRTARRSSCQAFLRQVKNLSIMQFLGRVLPSPTPAQLLKSYLWFDWSRNCSSSLGSR